MADRVHPINDSGSSSSSSSSSSSRYPPGTFVIRIPKDQIYKIPPPENEYHFNNFTRRRLNHHRRQSHPCRCFLLSVTILITILLVLSTTFYFVLRPETPKYSVESFSVKNFNISKASSETISPRFDIAVRAHNPNEKIGVFYRKESFGAVYYSGDALAGGGLPAFYQPSNNVTVFKMVLDGDTIVLGSKVHDSLVSQLNKEVPFELRFKVPVKFKVGSVKTWTFTVKVVCDVTVDKLSSDSKVVDNNCDFSIKPW